MGKTIVELKPITEDNFLDAFRLELGEGQERFVSQTVIGNPLMLSPGFPPPHTVRATFMAHGVPSAY